MSVRNPVLDVPLIDIMRSEIACPCSRCCICTTSRVFSGPGAIPRTIRASNRCSIPPSRRITPPPFAPPGWESRSPSATTRTSAGGGPPTNPSRSTRRRLPIADCQLPIGIREPTVFSSFNRQLAIGNRQSAIAIDLPVFSDTIPANVIFLRHCRPYHYYPATTRVGPTVQRE